MLCLPSRCIHRFWVTGEVHGPLRHATSTRAQHVGPNPTQEESDNSACTICHDLGVLVELARPGYWHFELAHRSVLQDGQQCLQCHADLFPFDDENHRFDPFRRAQSCQNCHGLQTIE